MASNMYRVGDYVFFETSSTSPYQIRRIEELSKTQNGNVEAKVMCFYRRRDISSSLIMLADKHQNSEVDQKFKRVRKKSKIDGSFNVYKYVRALRKSMEFTFTNDNDKTKFERSVEEIKKLLFLDTRVSHTDFLNSMMEVVRHSRNALRGEDVAGATATAAAARLSSPTVVTARSDERRRPHPASARINGASDRMCSPSSSSSIGALEEEQEGDGDFMNDKHRHQLKHRELFLSRQVETLPATHIRGKCTVTLLNETESFLSYLNKDDTFFYSLVYDPQQKTLLADKGEIRVGSKFQAEVVPLIKDGEVLPMLKEGDDDGRVMEELETLIWTPNHNLTDRQIDQFLVIARSVGTFARALDCTSSVKQPSLHMSAAAASRDVTLFHAMDILHKHNYNIATAICSLVPSTGPVLCRDEMEEWSASEANLFEEALEKYGKDFNDIRQDFLPWKSLKNIIEYYYMWKTTDRYVQQKRVKAVEAESKLKQVYIPNYNKPNPAAISANKPGMMNGASVALGAAGVATPGAGGVGSNGEPAPASGKACESCYSTQSSQWYAWGPIHLQCRLCSTCWNYWKKYGGLKMPTRLGKGASPGLDTDADRAAPVPPRTNESQYPCSECNKVFSRQERLAAHMAAHRPHRCTISGCGKEFKLKAHLARHCATAHGLTIRAGSPRPIMKTRAAFYLCTTLQTRVSRRLCRDILKPRHAARNPFQPVNFLAIKQESQARSNGKTPEEVKASMKPLKSKNRGKVVDVSYRLGTPDQTTPEWLVAMEKSKLPQPEVFAFPSPARGEDGRLLVDVLLNREKEVERYQPGINNLSPNILRKRTYEEHPTDGILGPPTKRPLRPMPPTVVKPSSQDIFNRNLLPRGTVINHMNGRAKLATINKLGRKQVLSWVDAPDDVYFQANHMTRKLRKQLTASELRKAARRPWRKLNVKFPTVTLPVIAAPPSEVVVLD